MASPTLEAEGTEIVLVGSLNPAIFHPQWLVRHELISEAEADESKVTVVSHEFTKIDFSDLTMVCLPERLALSTADPARQEQAQDLALKLLDLLPHTPLRACGINSRGHYRLASEAYWHQIGHALAPKDLVWNALFEKPGMKSLEIKAPRAGSFPGEFNVGIQPSARIHPGLYIQVNSHLSISQSSDLVGGADRAAKFLTSEWTTACTMLKNVAGEIFSKIPEAHD